MAGPAPEATLAAAVEAFLRAPHGYTSRSLSTLRNRLLALGAWLGAHGAALASEVTPELLDTWVRERSRTASRATINRDLRALRVALRWAVERGLVPPCPAATERPALREPVRHLRRVVPSPVEVRRILDACSHPRARAALEALYASGLRIAELGRLHLGSLREGDVLTVESEAGPADTAEPGKGYRERTIPLHPTSAAVLRRYLGAALGPRGRPPGERWLTEYLHRACDASRVPRCGLHDLRRAFATEAVRQGSTVDAVRDWLGHRGTATTERYLSSYRTDAERRAPVPGGLEPSDAPGAATVLLRGVDSGALGSTPARSRSRGSR